MQYQFKNSLRLKVLKKLIIALTNPVIYYYIIEISYANFWLITKLIILRFKYKVFRKTNYTNNSIAKPKKKRKLD